MIAPYQSGSWDFSTSGPHTTRRAGPHRVVPRRAAGCETGVPSRRAGCLHPLATDRDLSLLGQPLIGHSGLRRQCHGQAPLALATKARQDCRTPACAGIFPLLPPPSGATVPEFTAPQPRRTGDRQGRGYVFFGGNAFRCCCLDCDRPPPPRLDIAAAALSSRNRDRHSWI